MMDTAQEERTMGLLGGLLDRLRGRDHDTQVAPAPQPHTATLEEKRVAARYPADHHAMVCHGQQKREGRVVDFSHTGLRLRLAHPIPPGETGHAYIHFNGCVLRREFRVVRVEGELVAAELVAPREAPDTTLTFLQLLAWRTSKAS